MHQLLRDQISELGLDGFYRVSDNEILGQNGTQFLFAGLRQQDVAKIKSFEGVDIVWVEEAHVVSKKSWDILIPTIRKEGSEIWVTFNPELDTDETYVRFVTKPQPDSIVVKLNYKDNPWFPEVLEKERLALKERDPEAYDNVWEGNCRSSVEGAIYAKEISEAISEQRVRPVPYDPLLKVHTCWDLGWADDTTVILVQRQGSEIRIIDYIEGNHRTLDDYVGELNEKRLNWGIDWLPHDGESKTLLTGMSPKEILGQLGRTVRVVPRTDVELGIKAARMIFRQCFFEAKKAERLVHCLKRYRRTINVTTGEPGPPLHDEFSHGADAFRILGLVAKKLSNDQMNMKPIKYDDTGIV